MDALRVLLSLLLIKTNFTIQKENDNSTLSAPASIAHSVDSRNNTNAADNSTSETTSLMTSTSTLAPPKVGRNQTKFQEMLALNATEFSFMEITNSTGNAQHDLAAAVVRRLSDQFGENVKDMMQAWSWVPQWWRRMRQWTAATRGGLSKRCSQDNATANMISIGGRLLLCAFLPAITGQQIVEPEPVFLAALENHTVTQGRDVFFTCVVNHLSSYKVAWIKSDTKAILAIHTHMVAQNQRLSVTHNGHNTWKLHVSNVQKNDSGTYMCQINTDPMRSQMGTLEVVIPPDILNDNDSTEGGGVALEGGTVRLKCHAVGVPSPTVLWRREDSKSLVFRNETTREKQVQRSFDGDTLVLTGIQRADMGAYLCIASNGVPPSVSKRFSVRVHFHPLIRVSNQLVAAPAASDVLVQCYVEASPRAMNHWTRDSGEKLIPSDKYAMEETIINEYSLLMNLTIRSLEKRDFGGYVCTSSNALGKAEGVVRLQELHLIVETTTTPQPPRRIDAKRKPTHKEKPTKKYTRPSKNKKDGLALSVDEEEDSSKTSYPEMRTLSPPLPPSPTTRTPPWVMHHNSSQQQRISILVLLLTIGAVLLRR